MAAMAAMAAAVAAAAAAAVTAGTAAETQRQTPKNVLYFICDDLRPEFLAGYGQKVMITPNIDKLAEGALVFDKAYCSVAVCSPSRNSFSKLVEMLLRSRVGSFTHLTGSLIFSVVQRWTTENV
eukprot:SAG31_NODE_4744_length_2986_cov_1.698995_1_plen_124_part_00